MLIHPMSRYHLRAGVFGRLLKFFKAVLTRGARIALEYSDEDERTIAEDLALLHTLCSVWIGGEFAQEFYRTHNASVAALAAREVRQAIEGSVIHDCELCLDHLKMLNRLETTLASEPPEYPSAGSRFLRAVLTKVHPLIRSIRGFLPLRSRLG